ncbi:MAG: hypothetical protein HUU33_15290 [Flavobacteriales bacterium]|nr:hypothetical protein [Flavobacteriales bacterium]
MKRGLIRSSWLSLCILHAFMQPANAQQGFNNLWLGGYANWAGPPWGGVDMQFSTGSLDIDSISRDIGFFRTNTNITDANGNLLFSTNGTFIANATGDTLLNGTGLNPSAYTSNYPEGLAISQACLILPKPDVPGIYYLFHGTPST